MTRAGSPTRRVGAQGATGAACVALAVLWLASGCATVRDDRVTADPAFPAEGASWVTRTVDSRGTERTVTWTVLGDGAYEGQPVHQVAAEGDLRLYDARSRNWVATLRDGRERWVARPHDGTFSWPLRVGRAWMSSVAFHDRERGVSSTPVVTFWVVEAYETVKVPAGTFEAFRLHGSPGLNNRTYTTLWYAPELRLVVRSVREQVVGRNAEDDEVVTELVEYQPAPGASGPAGRGPR